MPLAMLYPGSSVQVVFEPSFRALSPAAMVPTLTNEKMRIRMLIPNPIKPVSASPRTQDVIKKDTTSTHPTTRIPIRVYEQAWVIKAELVETFIPKITKHVIASAIKTRRGANETRHPQFPILQ